VSTAKLLQTAPKVIESERAAEERRRKTAVATGACESDRTFFRQQPQRNFRLRPAWSAEIEDFVRHGVIVRDLPDGLCWWVVVHQIVPHRLRARWPLAAPHHFYPDPPENVAREIWRRRVPREQRAKTRALQRDTLRVLEQYGAAS
jgi:hypothetical protein